MSRMTGYNAQYYADRQAEREALLAVRLGIKLTPAEIRLLHMTFREVRLPALSFLTRRFHWEPKDTP